MTRAGGMAIVSDSTCRAQHGAILPACPACLHCRSFGSRTSDGHLRAGSGSFRVARDRPQEITFGIITSFGADNLDSVRQLKEDDQFVQTLIDNGLFDRPTVAFRQYVPTEFDLAASVYPVPGADLVTIFYSVPSQMPVMVQAFDLLGRPRPRW